MDKRLTGEALPITVHTIKAGHHWHNNTYVVSCDGNALVIDPSTNAKAAHDYVLANRLRLVGILITHSHSDHIGQSKYLVNRHRVRVFMHAAERPLMDDSQLEEEANELFHFKDYFIRRMMNRIMRVKAGNFTFFDSPFLLGGIDVGIIHAPGHTPGSCIYVIGDYMFTGDTLFIDAPTFFHVPGSSRKVGYKTSRRLMAMTELDDKLVMPGHWLHGVPFRAVKATNTYFQHEADPGARIKREWYRNRWFRRQWWHR